MVQMEMLKVLRLIVDACREGEYLPEDRIVQEVVSLESSRTR